MKKLFLLPGLILFFGPVFSQSKNKSWKTNFGIDLGLPVVGLTPTTAPGNPMVQGGVTLKNEMGYSGGLVLQFMKTKEKPGGRIAPSFGIQLKGLYNYFSGRADGVFPTYDDQTIGIGEMAIPVLFKVCLLSKEVDVPASRDPDKIEIRRGHRDGEYEGRYTPGQYHDGYRTSAAVFLYAGPQMGFINNITYNSSSSTYKSAFENMRTNLKSTNISFVAGMQLMVGRAYLDISYQRGLQTIYEGKNVFISGAIGRIGILF